MLGIAAAVTGAMFVEAFRCAVCTEMTSIALEPSESPSALGGWTYPSVPLPNAGIDTPPEVSVVWTLAPG